MDVTIAGGGHCTAVPVCRPCVNTPCYGLPDIAPHVRGCYLT
jgi:hypothetical protein